MDYKNIVDDELVVMAKKGDTLAITTLIERYKGIVKSACRSMFLVGGDSDDLVQEGTIGILKAIESYNGKSSFSSFAYLCAKSKIVSAIRRNNSKKNIPLNGYVSLSGFDGENNDKKEIFLSMGNDPETDYINKESVEELKISIKGILSGFEYKVLTMYLSGMTIDGICEKVNKEQKSIENALHRIRKKIGKLL